MLVWILLSLKYKEERSLKFVASMFYLNSIVAFMFVLWVMDKEGICSSQKKKKKIQRKAYL